MNQNISEPGVFQQSVVLSLDDVGLPGQLNLPENATSVILFVDGGGNDRSSVLNRFVAHELNGVGHATLSLDIMTSEEESDEEMTSRKMFGFHTEFLAHRVLEAHKWLRSNGDTENLPIGFYCTGDGAEAGLAAAARLKHKVGAIVVASGWINLDASILEKIKAPTLFITRDTKLEELLQTRKAASKLSCEHHVECVALKPIHEDPECEKVRVAELSRGWFTWYLNKK
jgi:putative phosphoribosyl transferase